MIRHIESRQDKGYEIQLYNREGNYRGVIAVDTLEEVATSLISICNGNASGYYPTVWLDGTMIR